MKKKNKYLEALEKRTFVKVELMVGKEPTIVNCNLPLEIRRTEFRFNQINLN